VLYLGKKNFVNVFDPEVKEKYVQANISSSKALGNNEYKNSKWYARFVGQAFEKAKELKHGERINITNAIIENDYVKDKGKAYYTVICFDFEKVNKKNESSEGEV
jgi:hypothetical protein